MVVALSGSVLADAVVLREVNASSNLLGKNFPNNNASEPVVAVDPHNPANIALTYNTRGGRCGISPGVRISRDGGATWQDAPRKPWAGSGRQPNWHAAIAWGAGPKAGSSRLYWADTTVATVRLRRHRRHLGRRLRGRHGRLQPGQPELRRRVRRHQLVRRLGGRARLSIACIERLRPDVGGDRGPGTARGVGLPLPLPHRLPAAHRPGRIGLCLLERPTGCA